MTTDNRHKTETARTIPDVLAAHRWTKFSRCECGWTVTPCVFPEPHVGGLVQFEWHVAGELAPLLASMLTEARAEAWHEGHMFTGFAPDRGDNPYGDVGFGPITPPGKNT